MTERQAKQVIVMRNDLNMRKGKMIAQGAHASNVWILDRALNRDLPLDPTAACGSYERLPFTEAERTWIQGQFTKVCVRVDSEEELLEIHAQAKAAGLTSHLIRDAGLTEFKGVPTLTCLAVGPNWSDQVDAVTGDLELL